MKSLGVSKVNRPLLLMLFAVLAVNSGWNSPYSKDLASDAYQADVSNIGCKIKFEGGTEMVDDSHDCSGTGTKASESHAKSAKAVEQSGNGVANLATTAASTATIAGKADTAGAAGTVTQQGQKTTTVEPTGGKNSPIIKTTTETVTLSEGESRDTATVPVDRGNHSYELQLEKVCKHYPKTNEDRCRFFATVEKKERGSFIKAYDIDNEKLKKESNKDLETCEKCLNLEISNADGLNREALATSDWAKEVRNKFAQQYQDLADSANGNVKKDKDGKAIDDGKRSRDTQMKIYDCEWTADSTDEKHAVLKGDDLNACVERRVTELSSQDLDGKEKDRFDRPMKAAMVSNLLKKVDGRFKKCLASAELREDAGCLDLAESLKDSLVESDNKTVHNLGHGIELKIYRGQSSIENVSIEEQLKSIHAGMASAAMMAERTGNFGPMSMYQNRLSQLHQYFLASQMRREQMMSTISGDPSVGLTAMNDLNNDSMLMARIEQEFQAAAKPTGRIPNGIYGINGSLMNRGMYGMNGMRYGMPPYGPMGPMMPYGAGMPPMGMPGMPMPGGMPYPGGMMPPPPMGMPGMPMPGMPYAGAPPFMPGAINPLLGGPRPIGVGVPGYGYPGYGGFGFGGGFGIGMGMSIGGPQPSPFGYGGTYGMYPRPTQYYPYGPGIGIPGSYAGITSGAYVGTPQPGIYNPIPGSTIINTR